MLRDEAWHRLTHSPCLSIAESPLYCTVELIRLWLEDTGVASPPPGTVSLFAFFTRGLPSLESHSAKTQVRMVAPQLAALGADPAPGLRRSTTERPAIGSSRPPRPARRALSDPSI